MVTDISTKLPAPHPGPQPLVPAEVRAWITQHALLTARTLGPTVLIAVAAGMLGWVVATAAAAFNVGAHAPLVVGIDVARWTFVAGVAQVLLRLGLQLERQRCRREPSAA